MVDISVTTRTKLPTATGIFRRALQTSLLCQSMPHLEAPQYPPKSVETATNIEDGVRDDNLAFKLLIRALSCTYPS